MTFALGQIEPSFVFDLVCHPTQFGSMRILNGIFCETKSIEWMSDDSICDLTQLIFCLCVWAIYLLLQNYCLLYHCN